MFVVFILFRFLCACCLGIGDYFVDDYVRLDYIVGIDIMIILRLFYYLDVIMTRLIFWVFNIFFRFG